MEEMIQEFLINYWHYVLLVLLLAAFIYLHGLRLGFVYYFSMLLFIAVLVAAEIYFVKNWGASGKWYFVAVLLVLGIANHIYLRKTAKAYPCPCCGYLTLDEKPPGTFDICPVCYWEDDDVQFNDPDYRGGANDESLNEARVNYKRVGASAPEWLKHVRPPKRAEFP